jgi:hypothetical protein
MFINSINMTNLELLPFICNTLNVVPVSNYFITIILNCFQFSFKSVLLETVGGTENIFFVYPTNCQKKGKNLKKHKL